MKKKGLLKILLIVSCLFIFTGCTSDFCTSADKNNIKQYIREQNEAVWTDEAKEKYAGIESPKVTEGEYVETYIQKKVKTEYKKYNKSCFVDENYESEKGIKYEKKTWKSAWKRGLMEGLLVYPISMLILAFIKLFGSTGTAKFFAIILVSLIVKLLTFLITIKGSSQTQKLQEIQPELMDIQSKYQQATTQAEKQKYALQMQNIYSKYHVNPLLMLLTPFITLPLFIAVWGAIKGITVLQEGTFLGLSFASKLSSQVFKGNLFGILMFVLMVAGQFLSMKLPSWLAAAKAKKQGKPVNKQKMNGMMIFMLALVLWTGFFLPSAMALYWTVGSVFSVIQTLITNLINNNKRNKGGRNYEKVYK